MGSHAGGALPEASGELASIQGASPAGGNFGSERGSESLGWRCIDPAHGADCIRRALLGLCGACSCRPWRLASRALGLAPSAASLQMHGGAGVGRGERLSAGGGSGAHVAVPCCAGSLGPFGPRRTVRPLLSSGRVQQGRKNGEKKLRVRASRRGALALRRD